MAWVSNCPHPLALTDGSPQHNMALQTGGRPIAVPGGLVVNVKVVGSDSNIVITDFCKQAEASI